MKRGKDDDKISGPMFPRLNVNNPDKGGPRAPPRNKMALYEQLSIPSQRFNKGVSSPGPKNASNTILPPSVSQYCGHERNMFPPWHLPPSTHSAEKLHVHSADSKTHPAQPESRKKTDEDDFRVPVFFNSNASQGIRKFHNKSEGGMVSTSSPTFRMHPDKEAKFTSGENLREQKTSKQQLPERGEKVVNISLNSPSSNKKKHCFKHYEPSDGPANTFFLSRKSGINLIPKKVGDCKVVTTNDGANINGPIQDAEDGDSSNPINGFQTEEQIINLVNDTESPEYRTGGLLQTGIVDRGNSTSCMSAIEISPDDVVGMIGQSHFWNARKSIMNQQRVFAAQVFELHRLIKVQKLLAGSPTHVLDDASAFLGKPLNSSSLERLPSKCITKATQNVSNHISNSELLHLRKECSTEDTMGRSSSSSVQNVTQTPIDNPIPGRTPLAVAGNDPIVGPLFYRHPSGDQWLIPVMTPSEGLVYKPYPGPGLTTADCGPPGPTPAMGNFLAPAYGVPASQYHSQGMSVPFASPAGHGYFPPYAVPLTNPDVSTSGVEQMNPFPAMGSSVHVSGAAGNFKPQSSCNTPSQKGGAVSDNELRASCASSASERAQGVTVSGPTQGNISLPPFSTSPAVNMDASQPPNTAHPPRVIRVVPHNARSASESAARIFQSIQKERKQYDSR
ncbi:unnamed protein product [Cuscuta epithymum]|uniref:EARLY FLOWERING 3 n=1 Tax=Cuscuta epithymum TaxID=186058 RepID=A0AAV0CG83_9ASTE|nr:unnamed protein product [Cuscuta epithymum]